MLTHALLRDNSSAISATVILCNLRSSSMNRACSRIPRDRLLEARNRFMMPTASSSPSEIYDAWAILSLRAQR